MHNPKLPFETLIPFSSGKREFGIPKDTLYRWSEKGLLNHCEGVRYTLVWRRKGASRGTTEEALDRFYEKIDRRLSKVKGRKKRT